MMRLQSCTLCGRRCIPLADYDVPVCLRCDDRMARIVACASAPLIMPEPAAPVVVPEPSALRPCGTHAAYARHKARGEHIDDACLAAERAYHRERKRNDRRRAVA